MVEIAKLLFCNSTNSVWKKISSTSKDFNISNFPESIDPLSVKLFAIVFTGNDIENCNFDIRYQIMDANKSTFMISGKYDYNFGQLDLEFYLENLETTTLNKGTIFSLGWRTDQIIHFMLIGDVDSYIGPYIDGWSWMRDYRNILGNYPISKLCIPGSHDAGMSVMTSSTTFVRECNTLTQSNDIFEQLRFGIRYFDIRPVLKDGNFFTGHYREILFVWEGANGESIDSMISSINYFTRMNSELVIIRLDHSLDLDVGFWEKDHPFYQEQWDNLFKKLSQINNLYFHDNNRKILDLTFDELTDNGTHSAVLIFVENKKTNVDLQEYHNKGFYYLNELNMYHKYSNKNTVFQMASDQFAKMEKYSPTHYFELSWILTQDIEQIATCSYSIRDLGDIANDELVYDVYPRITKKAYPNIILIDNVKDQIAATLCVAINWWLK
ncbi:hypothetical protein [Xenorhabdus cabanillasii]|uniref:Variant-surface-glycoprotein phospholipase C n=2 Tax=Xenorhabdus cabanillasii TaxID=351673 RepID=A0A3D9UAV5_9GAMM|nr:hypothetical protein [Xenorhabdus cabanillasii]PHM77056.1 1-phosphatidylinositol phosphodiesterase [Xenorhabdus cabanillasii JM26]REF26622.1 variant-surface-glycoprotein phospholipase C [Xenorhabdus cabanillasii]CDL81874.1 hypothetical protein XCR1_1610002 [Xenorhabdus cabanillasii JM26]